MASTVYFLVFSGFIFVITQSVTSENSNEWGVERSSVNPLSHTDEAHYSRDGSTESPMLRSYRRRKNCPANEHFTRCDANCEKTCDNYNKPIPCPRLCIWGCVCNFGLVRGPDKKCIKTTECPIKPEAEAQDNWCEEYEVWDFRYAHCPRNCSNYDDVLRCRKIYVAGCVCDYANGYVRGSNGKCLTIETCPNKTDIYTNEKYFNTAEIYSKNFLTDVKDTQSEETENPPNSEKENPQASKSNLWPIPIPLICGRNELLDPCPSSCLDDCNNFRKKDRKCMRICIPSCVCKSRHVRSHDGKCIKPYECPQEKNFCPRGEEYSPCHSHCEENCGKGEENKNNCQRGGMLCVPGCTCKAGLVRGPDGTCIYRTECPTIPPKEPPTKVCSENELYDKCKAACQWNCSNVDSALPCPRICQPGCVCKKSLIRGKYGKCVEKDECPKDDSPPDSYVTLNPPPYTDDDYHIPESVTKIPPISETENSQFEEIPPISHSKPSHKCPPRHRWVVCGGHCQRDCNNKDVKDLRCRPVCIPGCICEEGLVKGPDGKCIEKEKCPSKSDSEGDSYVTLNPPPYTDDDYHIPESVTKIPPISETENSQFEEIPPISHSNSYVTLNPPPYTDDDYHIPESVTKIPPISETENSQFEEISPISHSNQFPFPIPIICGKDENRELCPSICPDNCNNYKDNNRKCGKVCIPACICKKGHVRGPKGKCIKPTECPDDKKDNCKKDEMYSQCHGNCEKNCSNWAFDLVCPDACVSGCVCRPGRIRGPDGKCIIWSKCPRRSSRYPGIASTETPPPIKSSVSENNRLNVSDNAGCPNDNECTISCRHYGHRYGHCTGRNSLVCSCYIDNYENAEHVTCHIGDHLCPDDKACDCACRDKGGNRGECAGPDNMQCKCYKY